MISFFIISSRSSIISIKSSFISRLHLIAASITHCIVESGNTAIQYKQLGKTKQINK